MEAAPGLEVPKPTAIPAFPSHSTSLSGWALRVAHCTQPQQYNITAAALFALRLGKLSELQINHPAVGNAEASRVEKAFVSLLSQTWEFRLYNV